MAEQAPILDLTTLVQRPFIRIDGEKYELLDPGEISPLDFHRLMLKVGEITAIDADKAGEAELAQVAKLYDELCRRILFAPDEVHRKLKDQHRVEIVRAFSMLLHAAAARARSDGAAAAERSGATSNGAN